MMRRILHERVVGTLRLHRVPGMVVVVMAALLCCQPMAFSQISGETETLEATLSLTEAIEYALAHNRSLKGSALGLNSSELSLRTTEAEFDIKIAPNTWVGYDSYSDSSWRVGASVSKKIESGATLSINPGVSDYGGQTTSDVAVALNLPLLQGAGKEFAMSSVLSSRYSYESAKLSFYSQQENVVLQTVSNVYSAVRTGHQIELVESQLRRLQEHLALARIKEKAGIITAIDLYRAEIRIKDVQDELSTVREEHANNVDEVKDVLGMPQSGSVVLIAPVEYQEVSVGLNEALEIALANRIELEQDERQLKEQGRLLRLAENDLLPQLDLEFGYNRYGEDGALDLSEDSWTVRFTGDTDLLKTAEKNSYEQQRIQYRQAELDVESQRESIRQEVRAELNSLEKQLQRIQIRQEQVNKTVGKLRLAESKFRYGMADNFDLIEAQTEVQEAQTNQLFERVSYIVGSYRLRAALGTLLVRPDEK